MYTTIEKLDHLAREEAGGLPRINAPATYWFDVTHVVTAALKSGR